MNASVLDRPRKSEFISDKDWIDPRRAPYRFHGRTHSDVTLEGSPVGDVSSKPLFFLLDDRDPFPQAVEQTCVGLFQLIELDENWNSYGAVPVNWECIVTAVEIVLQFFNDSTPSPSVVPTSAGGVQLEWHRGGADLEIEVPRKGELSIYFEDENGEREFSVDLKRHQEPLELGNMLERISRQA